MQWIYSTVIRIDKNQPISIESLQISVNASKSSEASLHHFYAPFDLKWSILKSVSPWTHLFRNLCDASFFYLITSVVIQPHLKSDGRW